MNGDRTGKTIVTAALTVLVGTSATAAMYQTPADSPTQGVVAKVRDGVFTLSMRQQWHHLAEALDAIGRQCGCAIAFEEPDWQFTGDLESVSDHRTGRPLPVAARASIDLTRAVATPMSREDVVAIVGQLIEQFMAQGRSGRFELVHGRTLQVVPRYAKTADGAERTFVSLLDRPITLVRERRSLAVWLQLIARELRNQSGRNVTSVVPAGRTQNTDLVELSAEAEPARAVLERLLASRQVETAWRFSYIPYSKTHVLSIREGRREP